jgi:ferredoxin-NADP reductase
MKEKKNGKLPTGTKSFINSIWMEQYFVKINSIEKVTHDVLKIVTARPDNYYFNPGQATEIAINKAGWVTERRPFTFTSLPADGNLEFTIKTYPSRNGVTNELLKLKEGDELILHEIFGTIAYKGEGVFIAGGAGVTPFISIFRALQADDKIGGNKLIFANKTRNDIIHRQEFETMLGKNFINILSGEKSNEYSHGHITAEFLKEHVTDPEKKIYLCGPEPMMETVETQLSEIGIDVKGIIKEQF